jgi:hypothetical protein
MHCWVAVWVAVGRIVTVRKNGAVATVTRRDVEHTKGIDRGWGDYQGVLLARMGAVITAQRAAAAGELGAHPALRKSLVDLAAISELLADDLPAPSSERNGTGSQQVGY